jgi:transpeptidase family protein/penicillin-binding protein/MecA-like transpeptidase family protein
MFYPSPAERTALRLRRASAIGAFAIVAFAIGAILGARHSGSASGALAARFLKAWTRGDYSRMYLDTDSASRGSLSPVQFAAGFERALRTATATRLQVTGHPRDAGGGVVAVPVRVRTRMFGTLALSYRLKVTAAGGGDGDVAIVWSPSLLFPGLRAGERLERRAALPARAELRARDGSVLAEGSASTAAQRSSPLGAVASAVVGSVGPVPAARRQALEAQGVEAGDIVGVSGLERALDDRLRGSPGGELLATGGPSGRRVLASAAPKAAPALRTTVSPELQHAAVAALGGQYGGIVALRPSSGEILAVAGIGLDSVQPPGSTFKMVTLAGVLEAGVANPRSRFPFATYATLDGVKLSNAGGEECGGTLEEAFAASCNSVFAPLGVKLGAPRLVAIAQRFGFNSDPGIPGAAESTLPAAQRIQGELGVGSTAIGQGQVQASALEMAIVAATIGDGGRRPQPTFLATEHPAAQRAISGSTARLVRRFMTAVVRSGTGTAAAIPGADVAGKTGTAELNTQCGAGGEAPAAEAGEEAHATGGSCAGIASDPSNTDAWFAAVAPARHPRIGVGVLLVKDGAGGATAAPVAREVLEAGLHARL